MPNTMKKAENPETPTKPDDYFKAIVEKSKPNLPRNWREMVIARFPELDTMQGATLLTNIHSLKSAANVEVIMYMADLADAHVRGVEIKTPEKK